MQDADVTSIGEARTAFIEAAVWHGTLTRAEAILAAHPEIARDDIHVAAVLGDDVAVRRLLEADPERAAATGGPYDTTALVYLCLSKYLRLDAARSDAFLRATTALLDAGADPNAGFWTTGEVPEFETALYGAAGVAHHTALTRLLLARGADPNDGEAVYHSPESRDSGAMQALVETGRLTDDNLAIMLVRKLDWHDYDGVRYLLERGVDPNHVRRRGWNPLHHALKRDNALETIELLLDHGADPLTQQDGRSAVALAARQGRSDVLVALERRGVPIELAGVDRLVAACARDDTVGVRAIVAREPALVSELLAHGGRLLATFAGTGNAAGVRQLLDLGVSAGAVDVEGDGYFGLAPNGTALHAAAWRASHDVVPLLIERGAPVDARDGRGRTPLMLAVRACVDSYWTELRSPASVRALLAAGASPAGVEAPSGYEEVDALLRRAIAS